MSGAKKIKKSLKIKAELFEDKQNFLVFAWGQAKL